MSPTLLSAGHPCALVVQRTGTWSIASKVAPSPGFLQVLRFWGNLGGAGVDGPGRGGEREVGRGMRARLTPPPPPPTLGLELLDGARLDSGHLTTSAPL